jgi:phage-related protein
MDDPSQRTGKPKQAEVAKRSKRKYPLNGFEYYQSPNSNNAPVEKFMSNLTGPVERAEFKTELVMLGNLGPHAGAPMTKPVRGKIWEWRFDVNCCTYRVLYAVNSEQRAVLLHAFVKAVRRLPQNEIETAEKRYFDYLAQKR